MESPYRDPTSGSLQTLTLDDCLDIYTLAYGPVALNEWQLGERELLLVLMRRLSPDILIRYRALIDFLTALHSLQNDRRKAQRLGI